ncbi:hypothetical protein M514_23507 [Trichuris suis]|uniref:Uncharacterized protein n=1 Tax=Trichuris suis TaxID=68888 RepID=A0A085N4E3_9BILA|nr:hypothetical protein M514_23507 [Trichuris suis]
MNICVPYLAVGFFFKLSKSPLVTVDPHSIAEKDVMAAERATSSEVQSKAQNQRNAVPCNYFPIGADDVLRDHCRNNHLSSTERTSDVQVTTVLGYCSTARTTDCLCNAKVQTTTKVKVDCSESDLEDCENNWRPKAAYSEN